MVRLMTSMADMNSVNIFKKAVFLEQFSVIICHKKDLFPSQNSVKPFQRRGVFWTKKECNGQWYDWWHEPAISMAGSATTSPGSTLRPSWSTEQQTTWMINDHGSSSVYGIIKFDLFSPRSPSSVNLCRESSFFFHNNIVIIYHYLVIKCHKKRLSIHKIL